MAEGSLLASAPGENSRLRLSSKDILFSDTTVDVDTTAVGEVVVQVWAQVLTAFNAATTNVITVGDGTTADLYLAAADVNEAALGVTPASGKGPFSAVVTATKPVRVTYSQSGTAATTGKARVYALIASVPE